MAQTNPPIRLSPLMSITPLISVKGFLFDDTSDLSVMATTFQFVIIISLVAPPLWVI